MKKKNTSMGLVRSGNWRHMHGKAGPDFFFLDNSPRQSFVATPGRLSFSRKIQTAELHQRSLFDKHRAVVFVHGCFWHRHQGCRYATNPKTRAEFWEAKFAANVARDTAVQGALLSAGWRVATVWECALRKPEQVTVAADRLSAWLHTETDALELGERQVSASTRESRDLSSSK